MQQLRDFQDLLHLAETRPGRMIKLPLQLLDTFSTLRVRADGNCLWYSIVAANLISQDMPIAEIRERDADGELRRMSRKLRNAIGAELWDEDSGNFKDKYKDFWAPGEEGTEGADTPVKYIELLIKGKIFGGELELFAVASLLQRSIVVVNVPCGIRTTAAHLVSIQPTTGSLDIPLLLFRSGLHFDAIYPHTSLSSDSVSMSL
uniref:OTU domain-containing protein n=1 Tax=viral metagenome TaxID=1070528 RepID=A0A6C0BYU6_9ZZZZ